MANTLMTPKEKAKELIGKFKPHVYCYAGSGFMTGTENDEVILNNAKICANIAVDEVLDIMLIRVTPEFRLFWENVKQEIEKFNQ